MAIRTQIRLQQITGSFGNAHGKIRDDIAVSEGTTLAGIKATDLTGSLSMMASAIRRINGGAAFSANGFSVLQDAGNNARITYVDGAGTKIKSEDGSADALVVGGTGNDATVAFGGNLLVANDGSTITFGDDEATVITHSNGNGLLLGPEAGSGGEAKLGFGQSDFAESIFSSADGQLDIVAGTEVQIVAPTLDIDASSGVDISANLTVGGDLIVNGTTTTVNSTTVTIDDPIFTLGGDTAPASDDNKDRGIEFRYHDGTSARIGFFGFDDSTGKFTTLTEATNSSEVFSGTKMPIDVGAIEGAAGTFSGRLQVDDTTEATSTLDGSLQTDGGLSVAKSAVIGDDLDLLSDGAILTIGSTSKFALTDQSSDNTAMVTANHRLAFGNAADYISGDGTDLKIVSSGDVDITGDTDVVGGLSSTQATTLASAAGVTTIGAATAATISAAGLLTVNNTTEATSTSDGSLQTAGGLSVAKSAVIGDDLDLLSDGAILSLGAANKFTLTHANDNNGATITSTHRLNLGAPSRTLSDDGTGITMEGQYVAVGNRTTGPGKIRFQENSSSGTEFAEIQGRDLAASYGLILPAVGGSADQFLKVDSIDGINRQLSFATIGSAAGAKHVKVLSASLSAGDRLTDSVDVANFAMDAVTAANSFKAIDVFVNGQLLQSSSVAFGALGGSSAGDYAINTDNLAASDVKFTFDLERDDTVAIIVRP